MDSTKFPMISLQREMYMKQSIHCHHDEDKKDYIFFVYTQDDPCVQIKKEDFLLLEKKSTPNMWVFCLTFL